MLSSRYAPFLISLLAAAVSTVLGVFSQQVIRGKYPQSGVPDHLKANSVVRASNWFSDVQVVATSTISWLVAASSDELRWNTAIVVIVTALQLLLLVRVLTLKSWTYGSEWRLFAAQPLSYGTVSVMLINAFAVIAIWQAWWTTGS
jgi:hypothetical protein